MPNLRISQLPYVGNTGYTSTDIIPFVNYIDPSGTTSNTTLIEHKSWILSGLSSSYLPLSGGTVSGETSFISGLTANTLNVTGLTQTSGITSTGGITFKQVTINSAYTATTSDYMIDVTGGTFNVTLPSAVGIQGRLLVVKNNGGGAVTVQPILGQNIDDKPFVILGETNTIQLASNGSNWIAISYNISTVNSSTGVFEFTGLSIASSTTFNVAPTKGWIVDDTTNPLSPQLYYVAYSGGVHTAIYVNTSTETWVYLTSGGTISQSSIELTEQQRRQNIFLGKLGHANKTNIINAFSQPDFVLSPLAQLRDMFTPINLINGGIYASPNGVNLSFNTSAGYLYGLGINFASSTLSPNALYVSGASPCTFQYRTQTGGTASNTTLIDPTKYDVGGVVTTITGTKATNQRIYLVQNGIFRVQYGQTEYNQLSAAIEGIATEQFNTFSNFTNNGILIGVLSVLSTATNLSDITKARFFFTSKFGETVGAAGGVSTTTLQQAYNNSSTPEIVTNSAEGALSIKNGTGDADNITNLLEGVNTAGATTSFIRADGLISGSSVSTPGFTANTNGLTANTISATTISGGTLYGDGINLNNIITGATNLGYGLGLYDSTSNKNIQLNSITGDTSNKITTTLTSNTIQLGIIEQNLSIYPLVVQGNRLISGGVSYVSGLTFSISPLQYIIAGEIYSTSASTIVTLNSGDTVNDRIDVIAANNSGTTLVIEGTPSANPEKPDLELSSQLEITFVSIPANSSTPNIANTIIYNEFLGPPTEWQFNTNNPTGINGNSSADSYIGSKSISVTGVTGNYASNFTLSSSTVFDTSQFTTIQFALKNRISNAANTTIRLRFFNSSGLVNGGVIILPNDITYNNTNTTSWQLISIPLWRFNLSSSLVSAIEIAFRTAGGGVANYYLDYFEFLQGFYTTPPANSWSTIKGDDVTSITAPTPSSTLTISGGTNISSVIDTPSNSVVLNLDNNISLGSISATTISATTYQNLPTDIRVTGATYSNNTFTYTNNTGGTFNVNFNTVTGLTINGTLLVNGDYVVSGNTIISGTTVYSGDVTYNSNATVGGILTGAYASPYIQIGSSYTATSVNSTIEVTGGTFTLTLPNANQKIGKQLYIKNDGTGIVTISGSNAGQTIDGFSQRKLAKYEELLIQSDGSSNWIILNKKAHTILFGHEWTTGAAPLDSTIYYIGNFLTQQASTTQSPSRQVIAMSSGWATDVSLMVSTAAPLGTSEDSTLTLRNVTTVTNSTITTTLEHNVAAQLLNFTLSSPLQITKGDVLEIQWLTPNWGTNPAAVRHVAQVLLN
jgi:hypothetical protein